MVSRKIKVQLLNTNIWAEECDVWWSNYFGVFVCVEVSIFPGSATKLSSMLEDFSVISLSC